MQVKSHQVALHLSIKGLQTAEGTDAAVVIVEFMIDGFNKSRDKRTKFCRCCCSTDTHTNGKTLFTLCSVLPAVAVSLAT